MLTDQLFMYFFFQAEDGIRDKLVTGVQTCALPICNADVDLSGAWLTDDRDTNRFRIADGTTITARGFLSFSQTDLGFALSSRSEERRVGKECRSRRWL